MWSLMWNSLDFTSGLKGGCLLNCICLQTIGHLMRGITQMIRKPGGPWYYHAWFPLTCTSWLTKAFASQQANGNPAALRQFWEQHHVSRTWTTPISCHPVWCRSVSVWPVLSIHNSSVRLSYCTYWTRLNFFTRVGAIILLLLFSH